MHALKQLPQSRPPLIDCICSQWYLCDLLLNVWFLNHFQFIFPVTFILFFIAFLNFICYICVSHFVCAVTGSWLIILGEWEWNDTEETQQRDRNGAQEREPARENEACKIKFEVYSRYCNRQCVMIWSAGKPIKLAWINWLGCFELTIRPLIIEDRLKTVFKFITRSINGSKHARRKEQHPESSHKRDYSGLQK